LATKIISKGQIAVKLALQSVNATHELPLAAGQLLEAELFGRCCKSEDFKEGTTAFLEKRKPVFRKK